MQEMSDAPIQNRPRKTMWQAIGFAAVCIVVMLAIGFSNINMMDMGYGLMFIMFFASVASFVVAWVYAGRAKAFDQLINSFQPLAYWRYTNEEWLAYLEENEKEMWLVNKATLRWAVSITVVVGIFLMAVYQDVLMLSIILGIIAMLAIAAFVAPKMRKQLLQNNVHEACIGEHAVYIGGSFQLWNQLGARLTAVAIYEESTPAMLHIFFEYPTLQGFQEEIIRVPVPAGKKDEANRVVEQLRQQIK